MKRFIQTKLFFLAKSSTQTVCNSQMLTIAYDEFASTLFSECRQKTDQKKLYQALCYASIEFNDLCQLRVAKITEKKMNLSFFTQKKLFCL